MKKEGLTQIKLAEILNVSQTTISSWVVGAKIPRADKIEKLCELFRYDTNDLLCGNIYTTPTIDRIIKIQEELNDEGQAELLKYAKSLSESPRYKK